MAIASALYSSAMTEYGTPAWVFDPIAKALDLNFDAAASHENHKLPVYATPEGVWIKHFSTANRAHDDGQMSQGDGLTTSWRGRRAWVNPPYGRGIVSWVRKAATEVKICYCQMATLLLPARTETDWFQRWVFPYAEVHFLMGRIQFEGTSSSAPFPSVLAIYEPGLVIPQGTVRAYTCDLRSSGEFVTGRQREEAAKQARR